MDADTAAAAERLAMEIGVPVEIRRRGRGGEVALRFKDEEELQRLFERLYDASVGGDDDEQEAG